MFPFIPFQLARLPCLTASYRYGHWSTVYSRGMTWPSRSEWYGVFCEWNVSTKETAVVCERGMSEEAISQERLSAARRKKMWAKMYTWRLIIRKSVFQLTWFDIADVTFRRFLLLIQLWNRLGNRLASFFRLLSYVPPFFSISGWISWRKLKCSFPDVECYVI